jgi:hypothetical protein
MRREPKIRVYEGSNAVTIDIQGDLIESADKDMDDAFQEACGYNPSNILLKFHDKSSLGIMGSKEYGDMKASDDITTGILRCKELSHNLGKREQT